MPAPRAHTPRPVRAAIVGGLLLQGVLWAGAPSPAEATHRQAATVEAGYALLDAGDAPGAEAVFRQVLEREPHNPDALEGLAWSYAAQGEAEQAAATADARLALTPDDPTWRTHWLTLIREVPARREEAIAGYRALLAELPTDQALLLGLAQLLSWTEGRGTEAIAAFRAAVANDPSDRPARLGLAQVLSWEGELDEAALRFDALIHEQPEVEALLGRAQVARWQGDLGLSGERLDQALVLAPDDARLHEEQTALEQANGAVSQGSLAGSAAVAHAQSVAGGLEVDAQPAPTQPAPQAEGGPLLSARHVRSEEDDGLRRLEVVFRGEASLFEGNRTRFEPGWTSFNDLGQSENDTVNRVTLGVDVRQDIAAGVYAGAAYRPHLFDDRATVHDASLLVGFARPELGIDLRAGRRRRSLVDEPALSYEDVAYLYNSGSQGQTLEAILDGLQVREWFFGLSVVPLEGTYLYLDGMFGNIDDHNQRTEVQAGLGIDLLQVAKLSDSFSLLVQYDDQYLTYEEETPLYYSPPDASVHTPSAQLRWRSDFLAIGATGGWSFVSSGRDGFFGGGFFRLPFAERAFLDGRVRVYESPQYHVIAGLVALGVRL